MQAVDTGIGFPASKSNRGMYLVLDVEATGLPLKSEGSPSDYGNWPRVLQLAWYLFDEDGGLIHSSNRYLDHGIPIPSSSTIIHGIDMDTIRRNGESPADILSDFMRDVRQAQYLIGHNIGFDLNLLEAELHRLRIYNPFAGKLKFCTMQVGRGLCKIPAENGRGFKYPTLEELYLHTCSQMRKPAKPGQLHEAQHDAAYTAEIFFDLLSQTKSILQHAQRIAYVFPDVGEQPKVKATSFLIRVALPTLITFLLFILLAFILIIPRFRESIMQERRLMIKELTSSAWSLLNKYQAEESSGEMTRDQAQQRAASEIKNLRYGKDLKDYFWITDLRPFMVMHPYRPDLDGKSLEDFSDPDGKLLFVEFVDIVKAEGQGYLDYEWQWKDDSTLVVPKLSFVKLFEPWGWIIGTGIYLDDVDREIASLTRRLWGVTIVVTLLIAALLSIILQQSLRIERRRLAAERDLNLSKEKYRTLVESASDGMLMIMDERIIFANQAVEQLTGFTVEELLDQPANMLFEGNMDLERALANCQGIDGLSEAIISCADGSPLSALVSVNPIQLSNKCGVLVSILNKRLVQIFQNQGLELIKRVRMGFFTAVFDRELHILQANEVVVRMLGADDLESLKGLDLFNLFSDADGLKRDLQLNGELIRKLLYIRRTGAATSRVSLSMAQVSPGRFQGLLEDMSEDMVKDEAFSLYQDLAEDRLAPLRRKVHEARDIEGLIPPMEMMYALVRLMLDSGANPKSIAGLVTGVADLITCELIRMGLETLGPAPAPFQFITLGSHARREMTLATDQDNAIMYQVNPKVDDQAVKAYFLSLGAFVCDGLNQVGFAWCKGKVMAKNEQWCAPVEKWHRMISTWIAHSSPEDLLKSSILFDLRTVYRTEGFNLELYDHIFRDFARNDLYFIHMAKSLASTSFMPARAASAHKLDLKKLMMPLTAGIRLYCLRHGIQAVNSNDRLKVLGELKILEEDALSQLTDMIGFISMLRLKHQRRRLDEGLLPDNDLIMNELGEMDKALLKWCFPVVENWQSRLRRDFVGLID